MTENQKKHENKAEKNREAWREVQLGKTGKVTPRSVRIKSALSRIREREGRKENKKEKIMNNEITITSNTNYKTFGGIRMVKLLKAISLGAALAVILAGTAHAQVDSLRAVSAAGSTIVNGWYVNDSSQADEFGELSCELTAAGFPSVFTGVPVESLAAADTITVGQGFAMSSLESLLVPDDTVNNTPYDTVWFQYYVQNQGNASDSVKVIVSINDTNDAGFFTPVDFDLIDTDSSSVISESLEVDSLRYTVWLAQEAIDTFLVRVVLPGPLFAADEESLRFGVRILDSLGTGGYDAWPGTLATGEMARTVLDTFQTPHILHTIRDTAANTYNDTLWEYGDNQYIENYLTVNAPILRLRKEVAATGYLPGDTLTYSIFYENDGSAETEDTVFIVDVFPRGIAFLETVAVELDTNTTPLRGAGSNLDIHYRYVNDWRDTLYVGQPDSLLKIEAMRIVVPPGIGNHDTTDDAGTDLKENKIADGDSLDADAGYVTFKVRIR